MLSALSALHIPLSLLVPAHSAQRIKSCLAEAQTLPQFAAVVSNWGAREGGVVVVVVVVAAGPLHLHGS